MFKKSHATPGAQALYKRLTLALGVVLMLIVGGRLLWERSRPAASAFDRPPLTFSFINQDGHQVNAVDLRGTVWVANFIFTRCQGPCPRLSAQMGRLVKQFTGIPGLRFVSFTVDPAHDTPDVLKEYAERFGASADRWFFLTGDPERMHAFTQNQIWLALQRGENADDITHGTQFVLVDSTGRVVGHYDGQDAEALEQLATDARGLL